MSYEEAEERIRTARITRATSLDLSGLWLGVIPASLRQLTALRELYLFNNRLTRVPDWFGELTALKVLTLSNNQLKGVPDRLGELTALQELDLSDNQLTSVPKSLGQLMALRELALSGNQLTSVPKSLCHLTALKLLFLSDNRLTSVPESLGQLMALRELYLSSNQLTSVPESLGQLKALQSLDLSKNQLINLPEALGKCKNLVRVYLDENELSEIPESFQRFTNLQELYLQGNKRLAIPDEILGPTWREVELNPFGAITPAKPTEIFDYYFSLQSAARPLNEAKLMLIGWGGVGKTSLVNRLMDDKFNPAETMTDGIRISNWKVRAGADDVRLNVWDFGGQEMNHGMHRFFLTPRSLYLVVVCGREGKEEQDAEYWLEFIRNFGGDSSAIVVMNKFRQLSFELNERNLKAKYPFIRAFIRTDCADDGFGIADLRAAIERETDALPDVRQSFPGDWVKLKNRVSGMKENYLTFDQYRGLCREAGVTAESQQDSLAGALNRLGIALNFEHNPELQFAHILNPHWVTDGIYTILTSEKLKAQGGVFHFPDLVEVLNCETYPREMRTFLVNLMKSFDLCFESGGAGRYLMPEHLSRQEPEAAGAFTPAECLNFQYRYPAYPPWLLPQFITRTHELSADGERWRSGVILSHDGCRALVKGDAHDKTVSISVSGPSERLRGLLTVVRLHFDTLHAQKKLAPEQWVPLPDHPTEFIEYEELIGMEEAGELRFSKFIKGIGKIVVDVRQALQGIAARGLNRNELILTLSEIPAAQFGLLLILLNIREEFMSSKTASQAERVAELVRLAEAPGGMGLPRIEEALNDLLRRSMRPEERPGRS